MMSNKMLKKSPTRNRNIHSRRHILSTSAIVLIVSYLSPFLILLLLINLSPYQSTNAFTVKTTYQGFQIDKISFVSNVFSHRNQLATKRYMVVTLPKQPNNNNGNSNDDGSSSSSKQPQQHLFDIDLVKSDSSDKASFRVKDMSRYQSQKENESNTLWDIYDDDDDNDDEEDGLEENDYDINTMSSDSIKLAYLQGDDDSDNGSSLYERDDDDIQTEREDRLFLNNKGERIKIEKCVLVGVDDLSLSRRAKKNNIDSDSTNNNSDDDYIRRSVENARVTDALNINDWDVYFGIEESISEMRELIKTAGMELAGEVVQRLQEANPRTYIGTGKLKEIQDLLESLQCNTVVFDCELTPRQQKHLENAFNKEIIQNDFMGSSQLGDVKVIDRTALILDIFAQHARTREGKLQVDLALHEYRKPRLTKMWTHLERQSGAGGVGLRGPGESQLEIDKRLVRDRIIVLKRKIDSIQGQRDIHRRGRAKMGLPVLSLVGYTNAGKSTLLNYLTKAGVLAENILFATLDPTTRKVKLPGLKTHPEVLLTDTVGFIQKLPTQLVAAFRATLEEVKEADVLIHVIDVTSPVWKKQELAVQQVLSEIGASDKKIVRVLNKIDLLDPEVAEDMQYEAAMMPGYSVAVSALNGDGMVDFVSTVENALMSLLVPIKVLLPYSKGKEVNMVQEVGHIFITEYREDGTYLEAHVPEAIANKLKSYYVDEDVIDHKDSTGNAEGVTNDDNNIDWVALGKGRH